MTVPLKLIAICCSARKTRSRSDAPDKRCHVAADTPEQCGQSDVGVDRKLEPLAATRWRTATRSSSQPAHPFGYWARSKQLISKISRNRQARQYITGARARMEWTTRHLLCASRMRGCSCRRPTACAISVGLPRRPGSGSPTRPAAPVSPSLSCSAVATPLGRTASTRMPRPINSPDSVRCVAVRRPRATWHQWIAEPGFPCITVIPLSRNKSRQHAVAGL